MLHAGIITLLRLQLRAKFRWLFRGGRTGRSIMFLIVGAFVMLGWILPQVIQHVTRGRQDPSRVRTFLPALLLTFCIANLVTAAGERAIAFTPAESDFLFPGPFTRRQLLIYKVVKSAGTAMLSALIFGTFFWNFAPAWIAAVLCCFLALMFLQLLSMAIMLAALSITERAYARVRRVAITVVLIALAFGLAPIVATARTGGRVHIASALQDSRPMRLLLAPFDVFGKIIAADTIGHSFQWIGIAAVMVLVCVVVVMILDAQYMDAAAAAGRRRYELIQRARTRGIASRVSNTRLRAPALPRLGGIGTIAWRQLTTAIRTSRGLLTLLVMIGFGAGIFVFTQRESERPLQGVIGVVTWASIMLANSLRLDFRGDVDLIDVLKALPLAASMVCAGELVAPTLLMTMFHLTVIAMAMVALPEHSPFLLAAAAIVLPANFVLFAIENLMFLLFPTRFASAGPGDLQGSGRMVMVMFLKMIVFAVVLGIAAGGGAIAFAVYQSQPAAITTACVLLVAELIGLLALMAVAFRRFDPNVHTPV
jgi:hypothetical protein